MASRTGGGSGRRLCFACRLWSGWAGNFASFADCGVDSGGLTDTAPAGSIRTLRGLYAYLCISFYSNQNFFLNIDLYNSWTQSSFFKLCYDFFFVFVTESFNCNTKFYGCFTIDADKLVVFQFDNISICFCNDGATRTSSPGLSGRSTDTVKIRLLWTSPCCTTDDMVITSIFPPERMDTIFLPFTFNCFTALRLKDLNFQQPFCGFLPYQGTLRLNLRPVR